MTRAQLVFGVIGIVILIYFVDSWYGRNSVTTGGTPSPMQQAQNRPPPPAAKKKPARIVVNKCELIRPDQYRFSVKFTVTNAGETGAEGIQILVKPWIGGGYVPDKGMELDSKDPVLSVSKTDYIYKLTPGESVTHTLEFMNNPGYTPGGHPDCVQIVNFKEPTQ